MVGEEDTSAGGDTLTSSFGGTACDHVVEESFLRHPSLPCCRVFASLFLCGVSAMDKGEEEKGTSTLGDMVAGTVVNGKSAKEEASGAVTEVSENSRSSPFIGPLSGKDGKRIPSCPAALDGTERSGRAVLASGGAVRNDDERRIGRVAVDAISSTESFRRE